MSSQAADDQGLNAVMCYFPWFPYYLRYQIGFDTILNPPAAQADPSVAGQPQRLIHVRLYFPDGFISNPANFGGLPHPHSFRGDAPHFLPPHPHFPPPMYPFFSYVTSLLHHHAQVGFGGSMMWEEQHDARAVAYVVNGQPGEFVVADDTPYDIIPQCSNCGEFHREPERIDSKPPKRSRKRKASQQPRKQAGYSGFTGQTDTSNASPRTASERDAADRKKHPRNKDKTNVTKQRAAKHQHRSLEGVQGIQGTIFCDQRTAATITKLMSELAVSEKNDENVAKDIKKPSADPNADNDN